MSYYSNPTENAAIGAIDREIKMMCVRRYETTAGPLKSDTLTAQILHPFRRSYSWGCERGDRLVCQSPRRLA